MSPNLPHITICICTYKREAMLERLLQSLAVLETNGGTFTFGAVVADNDPAGSARNIVTAERHAAVVEGYVVEPERSFARVRNAAVGDARGDYVAFIDDDEVPVPEWLAQSYGTLLSTGADAVLGPVRPDYGETAPTWLIRSGLCERPAHPTGMAMDWRATRTGNVLLRSEMFEQGANVFDEHYATGGEDVDFFRRSAHKGYRFVWCEEAPVYETVPPSRCRAGYHIRRALLQGRISLDYATDRAGPLALMPVLAKSLVATTVYTLALPLAGLTGMHRFMKYLVKDCHHIGRVLAIGGIRPIRTRDP